MHVAEISLLFPAAELILVAKQCVWVVRRPVLTFDTECQVSFYDAGATTESTVLARLPSPMILQLKVALGKDLHLYPTRANPYCYIDSGANPSPSHIQPVTHVVT